MAPGQVNNSARAVMAAVARFRDDLTGSITTTGSAGSYAITSKSGYTALSTDLYISAKASVTNTAGATLNVNTLGAKSIRVFVGGAEAAVAAGQIIIGGRYQFAYDAALNSAAGGWLLLNPSPDPVTQIKVGQTLLWHTDTLPTGYLWANGEVASQTTYAALFAIIGTTYNTGGEGAGNFRLPDLCGRSPFGSDDMGGITLKSRVTNAGSGIVGTTLGAAGGAQSVVLDSTMIPSHTHTGTTGTESASHTHSGTTATESIGIQVQYDGYTGSINVNGGGATSVPTGPSSLKTSSNAINAHTHGITTGTESATHTHSITTDGGTGGGLLHTNMPPALIVNFVIRF